MSDSSGEKTEEATPQKLEDARKKGQVGQSKDASTVMVIFMAFLYLWLGWDEHLTRFKQMLILPGDLLVMPFEQAVQLAIAYAVDFWKGLMIPFIAIIVIGGLLMGFLVAGPVLSTKPIQPDISKISPAKGFKNLFSMKKLLEAFKGILVFIMFCVVFALVLRSALPGFSAMQSCNINCFAKLFASLALTLIIGLVLVLLVVGALDIMLQKKMFLREMRMTKDEVKREHKQREGDPTIKGQRKQFAKEMNDNAVVEIKKGTMALTAGSQLVVVLYYEKGETPLPVVIAKGTGPGAAEILGEVRKHDISVRDEPKVARQLFDSLQIGHPLADEHIQPVAALMSSLGI